MRNSKASLSWQGSEVMQRYSEQFPVGIYLTSSNPDAAVGFSGAGTDFEELKTKSFEMALSGYSALAMTQAPSYVVIEPSIIREKVK